MLQPVIMPHVIGIWRENRPAPPRPPPLLLPLVEAGMEGVVSALHEVSRQLAESGVRHLVVGGVAVALYGWVRATHDIDLLLDRAAYRRLPSGEVEPLVSLQEAVEGVPVNYLYIDVAGKFLEPGFECPQYADGIPFAPPEVLVCTKLLRLAMRDQADIVEMLKGKLVERPRIRAFLATHQPLLVEHFDALAAQADVERERDERASFSAGF
jgi:hypothetical protein